MDNNNYSKKYTKYLKKNMSGGSLTYTDIVRYTNGINSDLGQNWCYTGSIALYLYCNICGIPNSIVPNDIDIVYVPDSCQETKPLNIAELERDPSVSVNDGLPYYDHNGKKIIDLICEEEMSYYEANIDGETFKLLSPERLLDSYRDRLWVFNNSNLIIENKIKILELLLKCIYKADIQKYKKPSRRLLHNSGPIILQPNFFDDDDDYDAYSNK
jgi:hypothetical protein